MEFTGYVGFNLSSYLYTQVMRLGFLLMLTPILVYAADDIKSTVKLSKLEDQSVTLTRKVDILTSELASTKAEVLLMRKQLDRVIASGISTQDEKNPLIKELQKVFPTMTSDLIQEHRAISLRECKLLLTSDPVSYVSTFLLLSRCKVPVYLVIGEQNIEKRSMWLECRVDGKVTVLHHELATGTFEGLSSRDGLPNSMRNPSYELFYKNNKLCITQ